MEFLDTPVVAEDLWQEFLVECEDTLYVEGLIWHECETDLVDMLFADEAECELKVIAMHNDTIGFRLADAPLEQREAARDMVAATQKA